MKKPSKPSGTVKSGFLPLEMGSTGIRRAPGMRQNLPHTSDSRRTPHAYAGKDRPEVPRAGKRRRGMY